MLHVLIEVLAHMCSKLTRLLHGEDIKTKTLTFEITGACIQYVLFLFLVAEAGEYIYVLDVGSHSLKEVFVAVPFSHYLQQLPVVFLHHCHVNVIIPWYKSFVAGGT
jgi:hypothetical protein